MTDHFKPIYRIGHTVSAFLFQNILGAEAYGVNCVPKTGPFLLACNHVSKLDPFLAGSFISRDIYFFARKTLFKPGFVNWILRKFNSIPVDRDGGKDISALKKVLELLSQGQGVLIFPEGTRSLDGSIQTAKRGVGMMACKTQVPVVPVFIKGSFDVLGKSGKFQFLPNCITLVYGQPLYPKDYDPGHNDPDRYQKAADIILKTISELRPPCPSSL